MLKIRPKNIFRTRNSIILIPDKIGEEGFYFTTFDVLASFSPEMNGGSVEQ